MRPLALILVTLLATACGAAAPRAPELRFDRWLNGDPPADLGDRVVLVEFWTFG